MPLSSLTASYCTDVPAGVLALNCTGASAAHACSTPCTCCGSGTHRFDPLRPLLPSSTPAGEAPFRTPPPARFAPGHPLISHRHDDQPVGRRGGAAQWRVAPRVAVEVQARSANRRLAPRACALLSHACAKATAASGGADTWCCADTRQAWCGVCRPSQVHAPGRSHQCVIAHCRRLRTFVQRSTT